MVGSVRRARPRVPGGGPPEPCAVVLVLRLRARVPVDLSADESAGGLPGRGGESCPASSAAPLSGLTVLPAGLSPAARAASSRARSRRGWLASFAAARPCAD